MRLETLAVDALEASKWSRLATLTQSNHPIRVRTPHTYRGQPVRPSNATGSQAMSTTSLLGGKTANRIGFGAMQLAGPGAFGPPSDPQAARSVLLRAIELGVELIDTAQYYGPDVVNDLIREVLYPYPDNLMLVTKVGAIRDSKGGWLPALSPADIRAGVEANLRSLRVERMDLVNLRLMGADDSRLAEQLGTLADLRDEGKLELIGISNAGPDTIRRAAALTSLAEVQNGYSLLDRQHQAAVDLCAELKITFVPFFPLGSAFMAGPASLARDEAVAAVARRRGATPTQVALAWLLSRGDHVLLIPGTSSVAHLEENMRAGAIELDDVDLSMLARTEQLGDPLSAT
jgi:pyridoxine 4-dehydrogenase